MVMKPTNCFEPEIPELVIHRSNNKAIGKKPFTEFHAFMCLIFEFAVNKVKG